jgi:hypothetical protein
VEYASRRKDDQLFMTCDLVRDAAWLVYLHGHNAWDKMVANNGFDTQKGMLSRLAVSKQVEARRMGVNMNGQIWHI